MKRLALLVVLAALVVAPAAAARGHAALDRRPPDERGIVQAVGAASLVLRTLDGSTLLVRVDSGTRVYVNGRRAALRSVPLGSVAVVTFDGNGQVAAREVRAFGGSARPAPDKRKPDKKLHGHDSTR